MNLILYVLLSYVRRLDFIPAIECNHGGYFRMETMKEMFFQYIFMFGTSTIYIL
jgi:hypothetical protein